MITKFGASMALVVVAMMTTESDAINLNILQDEEETTPDAEQMPDIDIDIEDESGEADMDIDIETGAAGEEGE